MFSLEDIVGVELSEETPMVEWMTSVMTPLPYIQSRAANLNLLSPSFLFFLIYFECVRVKGHGSGSKSCLNCESSGRHKMDGEFEDRQSYFGQKMLGQPSLGKLHYSQKNRERAHPFPSQNSNYWISAVVGVQCPSEII